MSEIQWIKWLGSKLQRKGFVNLCGSDNFVAKVKIWLILFAILA